MSLSTLFITVTARQGDDFIDYPINVANIMAYPATNAKEANARIDLNAHFSARGYNYTGGAYSDSTVSTALFVKETPEEITQKIQNAQKAQLELFRKSGVALII